MTASETPEATAPLSDRHDVYCGAMRITVFVGASGTLMLMMSSGRLAADFSIPAEQVAAFVRAVSTPYSGGADR